MKKGDTKQIVFLIIIALLFIFACSQQTGNQQESTTLSDEKSENPVTEYGDSLISAYTQGQMAGEIANLNALKRTIEAYYATHEKYPQSLNEIKDMFGSPIDLSRYEYDPDTGMVSLKK